MIANETVGGEALAERLKDKAAESKEDGKESVFIVVIPQKGGFGADTREARRRLDSVLVGLRDSDLLVAGMIGDPDPYTATMNALSTFRVDDMVISTFPARRSGWLRSDLIKRLQGATAVPIEHVGRRPRGRRRPPRGLMEAASASPTRAPRAARGQPQLAGRAPAARDAAFHHLGDHDLRGVLHRLLLHPGGGDERAVARGRVPHSRSTSRGSTRRSCCARR